MWPSTASNKSFGTIACPSGAQCELPHCIFTHSPKISSARLSPAHDVTISSPDTRGNSRNFRDSTKELTPKPIAQDPVKPRVFVGLTMPNPKETKSTTTGLLDNKILGTEVGTEKKTSTAKPQAKPDVPVPLMPRKLTREPTTFTKRITLLRALHSYMKPQNDKLLRAVRPDIKALYLEPNQLIKLAVEDEAKMASEHQAVYENVLKQRLVKLKNMIPEAWVKERRESLAKQNGEAPAKPPPKKVDTGLTPKEEVAFLSVLTCPQTGLDAHGYVTKLPLEEDLVEAQKVVEASDFWEECERCSTRFQVFPDRREEDGALTTGGQCKHHWGRRIFPKRNRNSAVLQPTRLACCNEAVGSPGCTTHETHVFKVKSVKRLSLIMPFIQTPENEKAANHTAVCFDCEMGYTTNGLELMRLTVVSWPLHKPIIDVLVRPLGHILDVNTRFSGITAEQFLSAKPFDPADPKPVRKDLRIVESPYAARELFLSHVSPTTPILGHALENDLNTIRLIHPTIVDTVLLYPTPQGLPQRYGLRTLAKTHLGEDIQQGGAAGHDSYEDARTTGELVRFKIKEKWKLMKVDGWAIRDGAVVPPIPTEAPPPLPAPPAQMVPVATCAVLEAKLAEKRALDDDWEIDIGEEPPAKKQAT